MQVTLATNNDALARHRQRLQDQAKQDEARATELKNEGTQDLFESVEQQQKATDAREQGEQFAQESDRLKKNGRDQSARGLGNLASSSDKYSESFSQQEQGLADLKQAAQDIRTASDSKTGGLNKITTGLAEQKQANQKQGGELSNLHENNSDYGTIIEQKTSSVVNLNENMGQRDQQLNSQAETVGDFILAGADFEDASKSKDAAVKTLGQSVTERVGAETLGDAKDQHEVKKTWAEADAARHEKSEKKLLAQSLMESLKSTVANANASFHEAAAQRNDGKASDLQNVSAQMKAQARSVFQHARTLECSGQHHVAIGRQMQSCPWTYCQGQALEQRGLEELSQAQAMKSQANSMRAEAQAKALEAETARVNAEQAREVGEDLRVEGHGSQIRSELLETRSDNHEDKADKALATAKKSGQAAEQLGSASDEKMKSAENLRQQGVSEFSEGLSEQKQALGKQGASLSGLGSSLEQESALQGQAKEQTDGFAGQLSNGRASLNQGGSILRQLYLSAHGETISNEKIKDGIAQFEASKSDSETAVTKAEEAAKLLEQARDLELEGLRLQNSGQKMLLEARPKMADAAKLSAQSFDAFNKADRSEAKAEELIQRGNQKITAAEILKQKAESYKTLAAAE